MHTYNNHVTTSATRGEQQTPHPNIAAASSPPPSACPSPSHHLKRQAHNECTVLHQPYPLLYPTRTLEHTHITRCDHIRNTETAAEHSTHDHGSSSTPLNTQCETHQHLLLSKKGATVWTALQAAAFDLQTEICQHHLTVHVHGSLTIVSPLPQPT